MENGFIKLYRSLLKWEWIDNPNVLSLFIHCLLLANHQDNKWHGVLVKRGTFITSISKLSQSTGLTPQQVRTALKKLSKSGEVVTKSQQGAKYTIIRVCKFLEYQGQQSESKLIANQKQSESKLIATDREYKEYKEEKEEKEYMCGSAKPTTDTHTSSSIPTLDDVIAYEQNMQLGISATDFFNHYEARGWVLNNGLKVKDWKALMRNWKNFDQLKVKDNEIPIYSEEEKQAMGFI